MRCLRGLAGAGALVLLSACANLAQPPSSMPAGLIEGRLSVRVDGQPERSVSAGFILMGNAERGSLVLSGPLGTTAAQARWQPGEAVLHSGTGETRHTDLDSLGRAALGEDLPMAALFDWLRGRAWTGASSQPRSDGVPGFLQLGWQVDLARWADGSLAAVRTAPPVVTVRARVELPAP